MVTTQPVISLCMIVKNEEKYLGDCLESVRNCVDEIIIVDTGSKDRTVEIAESFGAKVFHHLWENDFSKHRNQSIGYAKGDWILWMDADELMEPDGGKSLRKTIADTDADSLMVTMICYFENRTRQSWNNSIKMFRNGLGIHFEGFVHNQVVGCRQTLFCPVKIYHLGYDINPIDVKKKFHRTGSLLREAIQEEPLKFKHHHDLAVALSSICHFREAVREGLTAIRLYKETNCSDINILWTYFVVASSYYNLQLLDEAKAVAQKAITINPDHLDSYFVLASVYADQMNMEGFTATYCRFTELVTKYKESPQLAEDLVVNKIGEQWRLDLAYGDLLLKKGLLKEAEMRLQQAAQRSPERAAAFRLANVVCRDQGYIGLAKGFVEKAIEANLDTQKGAFEKALNQKAEGNLKGYSNAIRRLLVSGAPKSPEFMYPLGVESLKIGEYGLAEEHLDGAVQGGVEHPWIFNALALACKYQNKGNEAIYWNQRALEMDEMNTDALTQLGHLYYHEKTWGSAKKYYMRSLSVDPRQSDALFRLSMLALMDQDLEGCITCCDRLMALMEIPRDRVVEKVEDISRIYKEIGQTFDRLGESRLHKEAQTFSNALDGKGWNACVHDHS